MLNWITFFIIGLILVFTPYQRGLFFDSDIYGDNYTYLIESTVLAFFVIWGLVWIFSKKQKMDATYLIVFAIPLMYVLAFFVAKSPQGNFDNLLRWLTYASFFILMLWVRNKEAAGKWLPVLFQVSGVVMALFALFGWWGWVDYTNVVLNGRLTGPLQYANTFGAIMGAYWLFALLMLTKRKMPLWISVLYSFPLVLYGTDLLLSYSRGVYIVFPVAWLFGLVLLKFRQQLVYILHSAVSIVGAIVAQRLIAEEQAFRFDGAIILLIFTVLSVLIGILFSSNSVEQKLERWTSAKVLDKFGRWIFASFALLIVVLLWADLTNEGLVYQSLPVDLQHRISNISIETYSAEGRLLMYQDALKISGYSPWLGFGGDGWRTVYFTYQSKPYLSNEIHNGYLEMIISIGWIGFLVFAAMMTLLLALIVRKWRTSGDYVCAASLGALAMLLIHAFIDFDFSYGTVWFTIFALVGMAVPLRSEVSIIPNKLRHYPKVSLAGRLIVVIVVAVGMVHALRFYSADAKLAFAKKQVAIQDMESAAQAAPYNTDYKLFLADFYAQQYQQTPDESLKSKVLEYANQAIELEPDHAKVAYTVGQIYTKLSEWEQAIDYFKRAIDLDQYNVAYYDTLIDMNYRLAQHFDAIGDASLATAYAGSVIDLYEQYYNWYESFQGKSLTDPRPLYLSRESSLSVTRSYLLNGQPDQALQVVMKISPSIDKDVYDPESKELLTSTFQVATIGEVLEQYKDQLMILSVKDEATNNLSTEVKTQLQELGSNFNALQYRGSFVSVIYQGKVIYEKVDNDNDILVNNENSPELEEVMNGKNVEIYSAGLPMGNKSSIKIDEIEYSKDMRGINVVVLDHSLNLIASMNFDTHASDVKVFKE